MKIFLFTLLTIFTFPNSNRLVNSVWSYKIADCCFNTLTFKSKGVVLEYDCELNYAFHSTYKLSNDILIIKGKDDSHSEDNGKITSYWINTYLIKNKALYIIRSQQLVNGKWKDLKIKGKKWPYIPIKDLNR